MITRWRHQCPWWSLTQSPTGCAGCQWPDQPSPPVTNNHTWVETADFHFVIFQVILQSSKTLCPYPPDLALWLAPASHYSCYTPLITPHMCQPDPTCVSMSNNPNLCPTLPWVRQSHGHNFPPFPTNAHSFPPLGNIQGESKVTGSNSPITFPMSQVCQGIWHILRLVPVQGC